jgi:hypothetical protein
VCGWGEVNPTRGSAMLSSAHAFSVAPPHRHTSVLRRPIDIRSEVDAYKRRDIREACHWITRVLQNSPSFVAEFMLPSTLAIMGSNSHLTMNSVTTPMTSHNPSNHGIPKHSRMQTCVKNEQRTVDIHRARCQAMRWLECCRCSPNVQGSCSTCAV